MILESEKLLIESNLGDENMNTENGEIKTVTDKDGNVIFPKTIKAAIEDFPTVPTKTSELINDTGFITTIPTEYITETELNTELSAKANITDIPSLNGYATKTFVTNKIAEASLSGGEIDLSGLATKDELALKADTSSIPTKTSELTNDSGFLTSHQDVSGKADKTYVDAELAKKANESHTHSYNNLTDKPSIPSIDGLATKKELTDGLATKSDTAHNHDETYSKLNHAHEQYLTEHQDISHLALKSELHTHTNKTVLDGITSTKVNEWNNKSDFDGDYNSLTNKPTIPTSLPANGGNANSVNGYSFMKLTQAEYDALETKSENVIYIVED